MASLSEYQQFQSTYQCSSSCIEQRKLSGQSYHRCTLCPPSSKMSQILQRVDLVFFCSHSSQAPGLLSDVKNTIQVANQCLDIPSGRAIIYPRYSKKHLQTSEISNQKQAHQVFSSCLAGLAKTAHNNNWLPKKEAMALCSVFAIQKNKREVQEEQSKYLYQLKISFCPWFL